MSLPSFEGLAEVREALLADRRGGILESTPEGQIRDATRLAAAANELSAAGEGLAFGRLELVHVSGGSQATVAALRADALLVAVLHPGSARSQVEKVLRSWGAAAAPSTPPLLARGSVADDAPSRRDPWAALRHSLARGQVDDVAPLRRELEGGLAAPVAGAEPVTGAELDRALRILVEEIGGILAGDRLGGAPGLAELAAPTQPNLSLRWLALHWSARAAIASGEYDRARAHVREALRIIPQLDVHARAVTQWTAAEVLAQKGDHVRALSWLGEARKRFETARDSWGLARAWLAEAQILSCLDREAEGMAAARAASAADPAWEEPRHFLARRALGRDAMGASGFSGLLSVLSVPDVLEFLRAARRTGLLVCSSARGRTTLRFRDGSITGLVPSPPGADDESTLGKHVERTIRELVQWKDGEFAFDRDEDASVAHFPVRIDVQGTLLNVFRKLDEDARDASDAHAESSTACA